MGLQADEFIEKFRSRRLGLITDPTSRQERGILVAPAARVSSETINEMLTLGKGLVLVAISPEKAHAFGLEPMQRSTLTSNDAALNSLAMLTSVEAREGVTTGISAADRATTVRVLGADNPHPRAIVKPGHVFPVLVKRGGVLVRQAFPEGAIDIVNLSGLGDAAVFMDVLNSSGSFASLDQLSTLASLYAIPSIELEEITRYRLARETLIKLVAEARLPTKAAGEMKMFIFRSHLHSGEHAALVKGTITPDKPVLTRVQAEQTFSDVFGGSHRSGQQQIDAALKAIGATDTGILIYLRRPSVGELAEQILGGDAEAAHASHMKMRQYGLGAQILRFLGATQLVLLTSSKRRFQGLEAFGLTISEQVPLHVY